MFLIRGGKEGEKNHFDHWPICPIFTTDQLFNLHKFSPFDNIAKQSLFIACIYLNQYLPGEKEGADNSDIHCSPQSKYPLQEAGK